MSNPVDLIKGIVDKIRSHGPKTILAGIGVFATLITLNASFYYAEGGQYIREQSPTGSYEWILTQGPQFKLPFLSRVDRFSQTIVIDMVNGRDESAHVDRDPLSVKFSDTYTGTMQTSWRFSLPADPVKLEKIYQATRNQLSLSENTLLRYAQNLLAYTGNQFSGEDYMQGGQNEFLSRLYYQAEKGLYQTKRVKRLVSGESSFSTKEEQESGKNGKTSENFMWVVEISRDANGKPITSQDDNAIADYGIMLSMVSIVDFSPDADLQGFMTEKKDRIRARSGTIEDQRNERERAITAQLTGERERIEARAVQLKAKDAAIIAEEKLVEVARQQKELAAVNKARELEVSQANRDIQEADYAAAKFEALAIKERGLASAEVQAAKYRALDNPVYMRELERDQAVALYKALPNIPAVNMPSIVNIGEGAAGNGQLNSALGNMSSLFLMNQLGATIPSASTPAVPTK